MRHTVGWVARAVHYYTRRVIASRCSHVTTPQDIRQAATAPLEGVAVRTNLERLSSTFTEAGVNIYSSVRTSKNAAPSRCAARGARMSLLSPRRARARRRVRVGR